MANLASPISCIIIASIPHSYAYFKRFAASSNSSFLIKVFKVKYDLTFLSFAYSIAFFRVSPSKFALFILALNLLAPKYTASAPFCTAEIKHSMSPAGDKSSILFSICSPFFNYYSILNVKKKYFNNLKKQKAGNNLPLFVFILSI